MSRTLKVMAITGLGSFVAGAMIKYGIDPTLVYADGFLTGVFTCLVIAKS